VTDHTLSKLPIPSGNYCWQKVTSQSNKLEILNWAGFQGAITYTYDDSQPSHLAHYGRLQATGVPMTFYLSSNLSDLPNFASIWSQAVQDGHEIGNHTASHPYADLTGSCFGKPLQSTTAEITECNNYIINHLGQATVWTMAAPFGDAGWKEAAKANFFLNRGVGGGMIAPNDDTDPFYLPCYVAGDGDTADRFNHLIDLAREQQSWQIFLFHTINPTDVNWYAPVAIDEITNSIAYAKSGNELWIDTVANIGAYWLGQKIVAATVPTRSGDQLVWRWELPDHFPTGKVLRVITAGAVLKQNDQVLKKQPQGYYEIELDAGMLVMADC